MEVQVESRGTTTEADAPQGSCLRVLTCGSVDDGKSTLLGRLLFDTSSVADDQITTLTKDSARFGTVGEGKLDLALLVDGLEAEREQGITIDVAYRFFASSKRKYILIDAPGHEEFTRNMATGASNADVAIVLLDARKGLLPQSRRHTFINALLGVRHVVLAVNKMDVVGNDEETFRSICEAFEAFAKPLGFTTTYCIPVSALHGGNVVARSAEMPWYDGEPLLAYLDNLECEADGDDGPFRFPIQMVNRASSEFRGLCGQVAGGIVSVGDNVIVAKSGQPAQVRSIIHGFDYVDLARKGQAVTVVLDECVEVSRGNMLVAPQSQPCISDQFMAHLIWFDHKPLLPGRSYVCRTETDVTDATVTALKYKIDVNSLAHNAATSLQMNEIGVCNISTQTPIVFDTYHDNRNTGNFVLIDRFSNATLGAGMIDHTLWRSQNIHWQVLDIDKSARAAIKFQQPRVLWFTGLSGSGKSTIANMLEKLLHAQGRHTYILDGDNIRHGLNRDLGFTQEARVENIRRAAEVAKLMADAGLIVLVSFISPFRSERSMARGLFNPGEFIEIFVDTPIEECIRRDPKGLYRKALAGEIKNFTGVSSPYENPISADIHLKTVGRQAEDLALEIEDYLTQLAAR
ncbi:adenylyl-sulfate kinase [Rhizobium sp. P32RR-XVIII]|uniref:adenylyl-sulfate kinase n=1 Tax=Rhizobium sp. P32RR-XVIII TaxID=2726738 RepID=UPI00145714A4|nr:adenylyl-sulfate kinase [Rhizobium sp. P32RR-XVIII]NLS07803.1 adenylyl-sulfate kinase [Rhizobium sp. P32RR-XVIII]